MKKSIDYQNDTIVKSRDGLSGTLVVVIGLICVFLLALMVLMVFRDTQPSSDVIETPTPIIIVVTATFQPKTPTIPAPTSTSTPTLTITPTLTYTLAPGSMGAKVTILWKVTLLSSPWLSSEPITYADTEYEYELDRGSVVTILGRADPQNSEEPGLWLYVETVDKHLGYVPLEKVVWNDSWDWEGLEIVSTQ